MAYRDFRDDEGNAWMVWDTYPDADRQMVPDELRDGWLTFQGGSERRRLVPAPVGWVEAPDSRLREWLAAAEQATLVTEGDDPSPLAPPPLES